MTDEPEARELEAMARGRDQALDLANRRHGEAIMAAERERAAIVAWLRDQRAKGAAIADQAPKGSKRERDHVSGVVTLTRVIEAIERGDHMKEREG